MRKAITLSVIVLIALSGCAGLLPSQQQTTPTTTVQTTDITSLQTNTEYSLTQNVSQENESNYQVTVTISEHPQGKSVAITTPDTTFPIVTKNETITEPKRFTVSSLQPGDTVQLQVGSTVITTYTVTE